MQAIWSQRVFYTTTTVLVVLASVYFARPAEPPLPNPLNEILYISLVAIALGALIMWAIAETRAARASQGAMLQSTAEAADQRDGRLYFELARMRGEVAQLRERIEQTVDLGRRRPPLAVVGATAELTHEGVDPDIIDLSRKLHRKMIEGDPA